MHGSDRQVGKPDGVIAEQLIGAKQVLRCLNEVDACAFTTNKTGAYLYR